MIPLLVEHLSLQHGLAYEHARVELPKKGIVFVTGPNGEGKSSLPEIVSASVWGKTMRDAPWWWKDKDGLLRATFASRLQVCRRITRKGKKSLVWSLDDRMREFDTTTKSQAELEKVVGEFEVWRRCSVLSSQDAMLFSTATDAQRKHLVETILGIHRFDHALKACRAELRTHQQRLDTASAALDKAEALLDRERDALESAEDELVDVAPIADVAELKAERDKLRAKRKAQHAARESATEDMVNARAAGREERARAEEFERRAERIKEGECPTCGVSTCTNCGHPIIAERQQLLEGEGAELRLKAKEAKEEAKQANEAVQDELDTIDETISTLEDKYERVKDKLAAAEATAREQARAANRKKEAEENIATLEAELESAGDRIQEVADEVALLRICEKVLGTRGVRAHLLQHALEGVEQLANQWLAYLSDGAIQLTIRPYSEKKTGGTAETIHIGVTGAGGGWGYKACSGGQKRRIDLALLLALAEVSAGAFGRAPGTLWADEMFDWLDAQGIEEASYILNDLAEERPIVVISHRPEMTRYLEIEEHLHIEDRRIRRK